MCIYIYFYIYVYRTCQCKFYPPLFLNLVFSTIDTFPKDNRSNMDMSTQMSSVALGSSKLLAGTAKTSFKAKQTFTSYLLQSQRTQHQQTNMGHTPSQGKWAVRSSAFWQASPSEHVMANILPSCMPSYFIVANHRHNAIRRYALQRRKLCTRVSTDIYNTCFSMPLDRVFSYKRNKYIYTIFWQFSLMDD